MNTYLLETFVTVVETKRITTAAKLLNLTQPAVSQQIRHLEAYFGLPLLTREQSGVVPTPAGQILYDRARQILAQFDVLEREIDDLTGADEREVVIGATPTAGNFALPCSLWTFKERFPKANLRLEVGSNAELGDRLLDRTIHLAVIEGTVPPRLSETQGVKLVVVAGDDLVLVTPAGSPWDKGRLSTDDLATAPFVAPPRGSGIRSAFEEAMASLGLDAKSGNMLDQLGGLEGMKGAVEAHGGVMVTARMAVQRELRQNRYIDITPEGLSRRLPFHLAYQKESLPPVACRFVRFITAPEELSSCWE